MSNTAKNWLMGCARSASLQIIVPLVVFPLGCVLILIPLWLVLSFDLSPWWLIVPIVLFFLIVFGGAGLLVAWIVYSRNQKLDAAFTPWGLTGSMYMIWFRQYHGNVGGRQVDVYLKRGPYLDVYVSTALQTRLGVVGRDGDTRILGALLGRRPLAWADARMDGLDVYAWEESWTRDVMARPDVAGLLRRLVQEKGSWIRRQVILSPGSLRLSLSGSTALFRFEVQPQEAHQWLHDLIALAEVIERPPAPQAVILESEGERLARSMRSQNSYLLPVITAVMIAGMLFCAVIVFVAVFVWAINQ